MRFPSSVRLLLFTLLALTLLLSACSFSLAADITPPPNYTPPPPPATPQPVFPLTPPDPANGQAIYAEKCLPCHGETGQGDGPQAAQLPNPPAAIGDPTVARQSTPAVWFRIVSQGNLDRFMPPFANSLTAGQRWDVLAYVYSLSTTPDEIERGAQVYRDNCAACHGESGQGDGTQAASLSTPPADFTNQEFMAQQSAQALFNAVTEGSGEMPAFADRLSEAERWAVVAYLRSLTFARPAEQTAAATPTAAPETTATAATPEGTAAAAETTPAATGEPQATPAEPVGTVSGQVVNGSGGDLPADLEVTLHGFDNMQETLTLTTTLSADGTFTFREVPMPPARAFLVTVKYGDYTFNSDIGLVQDQPQDLELPVTVYDTTTDTSSLVVDRLHLFFDFTTPDLVQVVELFVISNPTNRVVVAGQPGQPVVTFPLPEGYANLQFQDGALGGRYLQTADGFGDTRPVPPGTGRYQVLFAFDMPYKKALDLVQPVNLPVNAVVALLPEDGVKAGGEQFTDAGTRDVQGTPFHMYTGSPLQPGDTLRITLKGKPSLGGGAVDTGSRSTLAIGLSAFGLALIGAGLWLYRRTRQEEAEPEDTEAAPDDLPEDADAEMIMDAILALDDLYRDGMLPEEAYTVRRAALKARLEELIARGEADA